MYDMRRTNNKIEGDFFQKSGERFRKMGLKSKFDSEIYSDLVPKSISQFKKTLAVCRDIQGKVQIFRRFRVIRIKVLRKTDSCKTIVNCGLDHIFHGCFGICGKRGVHMAVP